MIACHCHYCGVKIYFREPAEVWPKGMPRSAKATKDHVMPKSRGGKYIFDNTVPACNQCNMEKGCLTGEEFMAVLAFRAGHKELFKLWYNKFREEKYV